MRPLFPSPVVVFAVAVVGFTVASGCAPAAGPSAEEGAAYLGLEEGTTFSYAISDGLSETHEIKKSGVLFEGVAVDVVAKQNGFANDERTLSLGVDVEGVSILRFFDCIARCGALDAPIPFLQWPLEEGQTTKGEAVVTVTEGDASVSHTEKHSTTVSGPLSITVPAGTFDDAFLISWTRTTVDVDGAEVSDSALLHWVPELGVVKQASFDDTNLELSSKP
jgi:hypothetical protein